MARYADRRASFAKTLPHDELGEVDQQAYRDWLAILASGDPSRFEQADTSLTYSEKFDGFAFRRFDGTPVQIKNGSIAPERSAR
jgi:hypothetical protein